MSVFFYAFYFFAHSHTGVASIDVRMPREVSVVCVMPSGKGVRLMIDCSHCLLWHTAMIILSVFDYFEGKL